MPQFHLSDEFLLVAACCEWPRTHARDEKVKALGASGLDWELVLKLGRRHRIEGLMHRALGEAGVVPPEEIAGALASTAASIGTQALLQSAESARLHRLFAARGIECIFLKGVALAMIAYGTLGVKQAWDIDLLVAPERGAEAVDVLRSAGYKRDYPGVDVSDERLLDWIAISKETLWVHPQSRMVAELHTGLVDNPRLLPGIAARPTLQSVAIGSGIELPTLNNEELFAYLCVHGGAHAWARLTWLADVAALLRALGPDATEPLYGRSIKLGAGRSTAQALLLCERLLALPLPPVLSAELRRDPANRWLERLALEAMSGRGATELDDTLFGTVVINLSHFLLGRGWRYRYSELARKAVNPMDRFDMPLPRYLHFLYPVLAVPAWIRRRYKLARYGRDPLGA